MRGKKFFIVALMVAATTVSLASYANAAEVKQGDKVTITTPETLARLCPHPNCGTNQHITRIPKGTVLTVEGIMTVKSGMMSVKWFELTYDGKRGWVSIYNTDKQ